MLHLFNELLKWFENYNGCSMFLKNQQQIQDILFLNRDQLNNSVRIIEFLYENVLMSFLKSALYIHFENFYKIRGKFF